MEIRPIFFQKLVKISRFKVREFEIWLTVFKKPNDNPGRHTKRPLSLHKKSLLLKPKKGSIN